MYEEMLHSDSFSNDAANSLFISNLACASMSGMFLGGEMTDKELFWLVPQL
ncbi:MAG: hypothetical protein IJC11_02665 [Alphaproteobacteria bacterium]|nr:hypothetical protein [Alphaproteobacteria bacterium]